MENRMRDLDQIQERDADGRSRQLGTILLATGAVVALTFAIGVVVGQAAEPAERDELDPLSQLVDPSSKKSDAAEDTAEAAKAPVVAAEELSFPKTLTETEDRPEVIAALRAAAAEEALLLEAKSTAPTPVAPTAAATTPVEVAADAVMASVPAAVAAGSAGQKLPETARRDPLVARALENEAEQEPRSPAARGQDGEFTLQVISYTSSEEAQTFSEGLRAKGHEAFVTRAEIEGRGTFYRVRIGPFKNRFRAENYRRDFERDERMNTFVVRRKPDQE
ncbi:MAG: SPOR domain-containing protein [Myxococcales bacterium]|nr:SPOR domain-containing protein [Myxococcales bacterium]